MDSDTIRLRSEIGYERPPLLGTPISYEELFSLLVNDTPKIVSDSLEREKNWKESREKNKKQGKLNLKVNNNCGVEKILRRKMIGRIKSKKSLILIVKNVADINDLLDRCLYFGDEFDVYLSRELQSSESRFLDEYLKSGFSKIELLEEKNKINYHSYTESLEMYSRVASKLEDFILSKNLQSPSKDNNHLKVKTLLSSPNSCNDLSELLNHDRRLDEKLFDSYLVIKLCDDERIFLDIYESIGANRNILSIIPGLINGFSSDESLKIYDKIKRVLKGFEEYFNNFNKEMISSVG